MMRQRAGPPASETDTLRQNKVSALLEAAGWGKGWRRFLLEQRQAGQSNFRVALLLRERYRIDLEASTVGKWVRQALQEQEATARTRERQAAGEWEPGDVVPVRISPP